MVKCYYYYYYYYYYYINNINYLGVFIPLKMLYPNADIPIIQISLKKGLNFESHYRLGKSLSSLLNENIMILGSGQTSHNLNIIGDNNYKSSCLKFCKWLEDTLINEKDMESRKNKLINMMNNKDAQLMHPRTEHIAPLLVVYGASFPDNSEKKQKITKIYSDIVLETLSLDSYLLNDTDRDI